MATCASPGCDKVTYALSDGRKLPGGKELWIIEYVYCQLHFRMILLDSWLYCPKCLRRVTDPVTDCYLCKHKKEA